jgi:hypothetical protein
LNNLAAAHQANDRTDLARRDRQAAQAAIAEIANPDPELTNVALNLALLTPDPDERGRLAYGAWRSQRALLGPSHVQTLAAQDILAHAVTSPRLSWWIIADACARYARDHAALTHLRTKCAYHHALWAGLAGAATEADRQYAEVVALTDGTTGKAEQAWRGIAVGERALAGGDAAAARTAFAAVVEAFGPTPPLSAASMAANARIGLARANLALGDRATARRLLDEAVALLDARIPLNEDAVPRQLRDRAIDARRQLGAD